MAHRYPPIEFSLLWKKLHFELTPGEEEAFARWYADSSQHRAYFKKLQAFYQENQSTPGDATPGDATPSASTPGSLNAKKAWEEMNRKLARRPNRKSLTRRLGTSVAASLLILLSAWYFWPEASPPPPLAVAEPVVITPGTDQAQLTTEDGKSYTLSTGNALQLTTGGTRIRSQGTSLTYQKQAVPATKPGFNTLRVPRGGQFKLTLSDGTRVWLNAASTLRYPVYFIGSERKVTLTGEAYFEVTENRDMPFRIASGEQVIEVLGTAFNVNAYPDDSLTATTLVAGQVKVFLAAQPRVQTTLLPGSQSTLLRGELTQRPVDTEPYTAWKDGTFVFADQPLEKMMKTLARWYDVEVDFEEQSSKKLRFTGEIARYQDFEKVLFLIEKTNEVSFTIQGRRIMIKQKQPT